MRDTGPASLLSNLTDVLVSVFRGDVLVGMLRGIVLMGVLRCDMFIGRLCRVMLSAFLVQRVCLVMGTM